MPASTAPRPPAAADSGPSSSSSSSSASSSSASAASASAATGRARGESDGTFASKASFGKSALVSKAEALPRSGAGLLASGYLRKMNSSNRWQRRWFEVLVSPAEAYFVYYKQRDSAELLCAMDVWRSSRPQLLVPESAAERAAAAAAAVAAAAAERPGAKPAAVAAAAAAAAASSAVAAGAAAGAAPREGDCDFAITWDRYRVFRAGSRAEALRFARAIDEAQARKPAAAGERPAASPAEFAAVVEQRAAVRASGRDPNAATYGTAGEKAKQVKQVVAANWGETAAASAKGGGKGVGGEAAQASCCACVPVA